MLRIYDRKRNGTLRRYRVRDTNRDDAQLQGPQLVDEAHRPGDVDAAERYGRPEHAVRPDARRRHVHRVHRRRHGRSGQAVRVPVAGLPH